MEAIEQRTMRKVVRHLIPLAIICYFVNYLDRVNLSFAALEMNKDLGFSATVYGFGAGVFFIAYFLLETPSNLIMVKVGARRWIARIMFTWGLLSGAMAFIQGETSFYVLRFLLGAARGGLFSGHAVLPLAVLSRRLPRPHGQHVHGRHCLFRRLWCTGFQPDPLHEQLRRPQRLAMGVPDRGCARADPLRCHSAVPQGLTRRSHMAGR